MKQFLTLATRPIFVLAITLLFVWPAFATDTNIEKTTTAESEPSYHIAHGPYLQALSYDGVIISFTTSHNGFSAVELRRKGEEQIRTCRTVEHGLFMANNTHNVIEIGELEPATEYEYRIVSKQMLSFEPYRVRFGEQVESPWYEFRTFDPKATEFSFVMANDIHDNADKCDKLFAAAKVEKADMVFYNGDIMSHFSKPGQPFASFIDVSVEHFATSKPFAVVRGNHETRGQFARSYDQYIRNNPQRTYYGVYYFGDTAIVMLDCGEDKDDAHPVYAGLVDFDNYRREQAKWLEQVVNSKAFRKSKHRIVMCHIPPTDKRMGEVEKNRKRVSDLLTWRGNVHLAEVMLPILNKADIDVMLSAHLHSFQLFPKQKGVVEFPIIANDNVSAMQVRCSAEGIDIKIVDMQGKSTFEQRF